MKTIRILIADDHSMVVDGLKAVLKAYEEMEVCSEARDGVEALELLNTIPVDLVILDINMPRMDGITCCRTIRKSWPEIKIIILTMYSQKSFIEEIIRAGAHGCLLKSNTGKELNDAIRRVMTGKAYYDQLQGFSTEGEDVSRFKLSVREVEIVKLLAQGLNSQEIGDKLFIAEHTVKTHRKNILRKLELHSTSQLVHFALNNQII